MNNKSRPKSLDWAIAITLIVPTLVGLIWWLLQPTPETKLECQKRVANEISSRKKDLGETTIKNQQEIEAIASEIKSKCP